MGVIADVRIPAHRFEFGRRLPVRNGDDAEIERVGTVGDGDMSVFSLSETLPDGEDDRVDDPFVDVDGCRLEVVETFDGHEIHVVAWEPDADPFFRLIDDHDGSVRRGAGTGDAWTFETKFPRPRRVRVVSIGL
jgi:hypothetical protein